MEKHIILAWVFKHRAAKPLDHSESFWDGSVHSLIMEVKRSQRKHQCFSRAYSTLNPRSG